MGQAVKVTLTFPDGVSLVMHNKKNDNTPAARRQRVTDLLAVPGCDVTRTSQSTFTHNGTGQPGGTGEQFAMPESSG